MNATTQERPPYLWALATFAVVLVIYLVTLAPTTAFWDTSEYIAAAKVLGIPHPPGNPLFVIMAHTFGLLPLAGRMPNGSTRPPQRRKAAAGPWFRG
jgi:fatty acid desaturase